LSVTFKGMGDTAPGWISQGKIRFICPYCGILNEFICPYCGILNEIDIPNNVDTSRGIILITKCRHCKAQVTVSTLYTKLSGEQ